MTPASVPFRFVYQDESGEAGGSTQKHFLVGLLLVRNREPVWNAIGTARNWHHFGNEIHFSKTSDLREKVYLKILDEVAKVRAHFAFTAIAVPADRVRLRFFRHKRHIAYNYFTRLLMSHRCSSVEGATMYVDQKNRATGDNFGDYIKNDVNRREGRQVLLNVQPICSKSDDLVQLTDLLLGCANSLLGHNSDALRKASIRERAETLRLVTSSQIWVWKPNKR